MQTIKAVPSISQRIRFNLIRHRGTRSFIPSGKLFKSFFKTLQNADPTLVFLPYHTAHYSSLLNIKQIQELSFYNSSSHIIRNRDTQLVAMFTSHLHSPFKNYSYGRRVA
jgi:hypothetical protein